MNIKQKALEQAINNSIDGVKHGYWDNESFAIYSQDGIEVQILVTGEEDEMMGDILPEYDKA